MERQILESMRYHLDVDGPDLLEAVGRSVEEALQVRIESDIRAFEAVAHPDRDSEARRCRNQMRSDLNWVDLRAVAEDYLVKGLSQSPNSGKRTLSLDENLLGAPPLRSGAKP